MHDRHKMGLRKYFDDFVEEEVSDEATEEVVYDSYYKVHDSTYSAEEFSVLCVSCPNMCYQDDRYTASISLLIPHIPEPATTD